MRDVLHTFYLGCIGQWVLHTLWLFIVSNIWNVPSSNQLENDELSMSQMSIDLNAWYKATPRNNLFSQLKTLDAARLGSRSEKKLSAKASETKGLFYFTRYLLTRHASRLPAHFVDVQQSSDGMHTLLEHISGLKGRHPCPATHREMMNGALQFLRGSRAMGIPFTPKFHYLLHLVWDSRINGDPKLYATYLDESLNKELGTTGQRAYAHVWHQRVFFT